MGQSRLQLSKSDIEGFFKSAKQNIFKRKDILEILSENRQVWNLTSSMTANDFLNFLTQTGFLTIHEWKFPQRKETRFVRGKVSEYELILSLRPEGYFSHLTALVLHQLVNKTPKSLYLNHEQRPKHRIDSELIQERIYFAFQGKCRVTRNFAKYDGKRVYLLNGKNTGGLGVTSVCVSPRCEVRVTDVERTLIDCVVRPIYSGGVGSVLSAFRAASGKISVTTLVETLDALDYLYPYHQALGFYLESAGVYTVDEVSILDKKERHFDFYLAHDMRNPNYSKKWRIYYPSHL